ncbi:hypothetical protein SAMN05443432_102293 [Roseovarius litoreus]|uniref:Uncharacterized protein n=1 Tax=Roseovarius litoreus TaxID=1155722 RepID=A0A1M7CT99_9RHOB|nr:hypothetical protein [Roseovarius litoreus]SHL70472.1 hypothetical protein SAMN05443432_102293 [Roseovarius litoreus]
MMDYQRQFTRPLLMRITDHGAAFAGILANRAEHDLSLAGHMLAALDEMQDAFPDLETEGIAQPFYPLK